MLAEILDTTSTLCRTEFFHISATSIYFGNPLDVNREVKKLFLWFGARCEEISVDSTRETTHGLIHRLSTREFPITIGDTFI